MAVLYRKYRPQTFAEVLSQKAIIQTLKNQVQSGAVAHAYLFTGSRGVGKTSVARILAKAVNCLHSKDGDADGSCDICTQIGAGNFLDLVEIDAASNTGVDNIRDLIEHVRFAPSVGKYKVFIIDEVHMLSKGAFNALLKTLEEPPKHAIFILATTEINKVPATIISRTQRFEFKAYSTTELLELIEKIAKEEDLKLGKEILELVAQNADGSARDSLSLLGKVASLGNEASLQEVEQLLGITDVAVCAKLLQLIATGAAGQIPDFYQELFERGADHTIFNRDFLEYLRKALVFKISNGKTEFSLSPENKSQLEQLAEKFSVQDLIFIIRLFLKSYKDLSGSPNPQVPLLIAAIEAAARKSAGQLVSKTASQQDSSELKKKPEIKIEEPAGQMVSQSASTQGWSPDQNVGVSQQDNTSLEEAVLTLEQALEIWPKMIAKVKDINGPLASVLRVCQVLDTNKNKILVGVKFQFDKQNLESAKNSTVINTVFEQISGKKISVSAQVLKASQEKISTAEALTGALQVFGGELVE